MQDWNFEMVNFLLDAGADPGAVGKNGMTPLMCCAQVRKICGTNLQLFSSLCHPACDLQRVHLSRFGHT